MSGEEFGLFALAFAGGVLLIGSVRAFGAEMLLFQYSDDPDDRDQQVIGCYQFSLVAAVASFLVGFSAMSVVSGSVELGSLFALALAAPIVHDFGRYNLIGEGRVRAATFLEFASLLALSSAFFVPVSGFLGLFAVWGISELVALLIVVFLYRNFWSWGAGPLVAWTVSGRQSGSKYLADFWLTNGLTSGGAFVVSLISGPVAAGAIRAAQVLLSPALLVTRGVALAAAPEITRHARAGDRRGLMRTCTVIAFGAVMAAGLTVLAAALLPYEWIVILLADVAEAGLATLPAAAGVVAASGVALTAGIGLRALGKIDLALRSKLITFPISAIGLTIGAFTGAAAGSQIGLSIGESVRAVNNVVLVVNKSKE